MSILSWVTCTQPNFFVIPKLIFSRQRPLPATLPVTLTLPVALAAHYKQGGICGTNVWGIYMKIVENFKKNGGQIEEKLIFPRTIGGTILCPPTNTTYPAHKIGQCHVNSVHMSSGVASPNKWYVRTMLE